MIVREEADGTLLLIGQPDHAKLSGQFAAHWGNDRFKAPQPYESVVRAAAFHDSGWYRYETSPMLDEASGKTPLFMRVPWGPVQRSAFQWAIDWLTDIDPYSGLLVSRHRTGLQRGRYDVVSHPTVYNSKNMPDDNLDFIVENEKRQEVSLQQFDRAEFETNYRLLQTWDLMSLNLCNKQVQGDYIAPVPTSYDGGAGTIELNLKTIKGLEISVDPYPFDVRPLHAQVVARRLPKQTFATEAEFRKAYFQAPFEMMSFTLS